MAVDSASSKERQRRLQSRLDALLDRIQVLERKQPVHIRADLLHQRQESCFERIAALERSAGIAEPGDGMEVTRHPAAARTSVPAQADDGSYVPRAPPSAAPPLDPSASPTQARLHEELVRKGITNFRFVRAPPQYYSATLQFRMGVLKAASIYHLCKSIVMENTRAHSSVRGIEDPRNSKYYLVLVQYAARLNADKLRNHIHKSRARRVCRQRRVYSPRLKPRGSLRQSRGSGTGKGLAARRQMAALALPLPLWRCLSFQPPCMWWNEGRTSKKYFNMRLCPEAVSDELTGFSHNGVSPVGLQTPLPMILSDRITQLQPDFFWIGGGEVDLKLGLSAQDFVRAYNPYVLDCTHDDDDGDAATGLESAAP